MLLNWDLIRLTQAGVLCLNLGSSVGQDLGLRSLTEETTSYMAYMAALSQDWKQETSDKGCTKILLVIMYYA